MEDLTNEDFKPKDMEKSPFFDMNPTKAPGTDGFHAIFYQTFWRFVDKEVTSVCIDVLNGKASAKDLNRTNLVLILKF